MFRVLPLGVAAVGAMDCSMSRPGCRPDHVNTPQTQ